ncbi:MAG: DMT family transporter [Roseovarius sp.]
MPLFALVALTMLNFAGNSLLTRAGVTLGGLSAVEFALIRLGSGALMLAVLVMWRGSALRWSGRVRLTGVASLLLYLFGFSVAYLGMDSGMGALILFGMVQVTMFAGALLNGEPLPRQRWIGAGLATLGLVWLLWPSGAAAVSLTHGLAMALAGVGWGMYSLAGRKEPDALAGTAANFIMAAAIVALAWGGSAMSGAAWAQDMIHAMPLNGVLLACVAGAITSALGYALWYTVLPQLQAAVAAVAQLTVPVIAMLGGMVWLNEALSLRFVLAAVLVLGGVAISVRQGRGPKPADKA